MRLGVTITAHEAIIAKILTGDENALSSTIESGAFKLDGDSYIPEDVVMEYNDAHDTSFEEDDVTFQL